MKKYLGILVLFLSLFISGCSVGLPDGGNTDNPNQENPGIENPGGEQPGIDNPGGENPGGEQPGVDNPGGENPGEDKPSDNVEDVELITTGYSFESIYCEWTPYAYASSYNVYCDGELIDKELIRNYNSYYRADIVGLTEKEYIIKVAPIVNGKELTGAEAEFKMTPLAHVREGFAFVNGSSSGAYNDDGTLKSDARVLYVTNETKDTVTLKVQTGKSSYQDMVGVQNILTGLKKGYETKPVCFRFIGNITDPSTLDKGDLLIDGGSKFKGGLTLEGIGNDATFNGFGLRIKNISNVEIRNLGFMNCDSDEGDNISLQQDNDHVWVHNCDLFYGEAGSDADQNKGDGALDVKKSAYITLSFNHYYDSGKCNLQGMKDETTENYITYHHNWFDHSDSRHPRVRTCTVHIYNNYYDGNSKYGVGSTMGSSLFVENNYFRNCKNPMLSSLQGTDALGDGTFSGENGGIIKAYGNTIIGGNSSIKYSQNNKSFDYYDASSRDEVVPGSVKALVGGTTYNNFDTSSNMYAYNVQSAEDAKNDVIKYAGRVQGGDFKWTFTESDDSSYDIIPELKAALLAYKGKINLEEQVDLSALEYNISTIPSNPTYDDIALIEHCYEEYMALPDSHKELLSNADYLIEKYELISSIKIDYVISAIDTMDSSNEEEVKEALKLYNSLTNEEKKAITNYSKLEDAMGSVEVDKIVHNFNDGKESSFFTIAGNTSTAEKYGVPLTYEGLTIKKCLKLESSTSITFTTETKMTLTLVFSKYVAPTIKIDNVGYGSDAENFIEHNGYYLFVIELEAGEHLISKKDSQVIFYMTLE